MKAILNPNTSGQGQVSRSNLTEGNYRIVECIEKWGYVYTHSTPVTHGTGVKAIYHSFEFPGTEQKVGFYDDTLSWGTKTTPASAHSWAGYGVPELEAHLKSKARRYDLKPTTVEVVIRGCVQRVSPAMAKELEAIEREQTRQDWNTNQLP